MQALAVFATILAAASATTVINSQRVGGSFAYSTAETQPIVSPYYAHNIVAASPVAYSTVSGVPVSTLGYQYVNGLNYYSNVNGLPVVSNQLGNVAVVRSSDGQLVNQLGNVAVVRSAEGQVVSQNVVVPATTTHVSNVGTPASTTKVSEVNTPITLSSYGVVPVTYGNVVLAKK